MSSHARMRDKTWWRTPWTLEKELGIFGTSSSTQEPDYEHFEVNEVEEVKEMPNNELSSDLWDIPEATGAPSTMEADVDVEGDETNGLEVYGYSYNWTKAILHGLRTKILFLQSRARNNEGGKTIPVVWAPCFVHILFGLDVLSLLGTPLQEAELWVGWTHVTKDTDMSLAQLHSKFPKLITSLSDLRQRCKLPEEIPIASTEQPQSTRRPRAEDKQPEEIPIASPEQPVSSKRPHAEENKRGLSSTKIHKISKPPNVSIPLPTPLPINTIVTDKLGQLPTTESQSKKELTAHLRRDITQVINSHLLPYVQARIQRHFAAIETWTKAYEDQLSKVRELQETNDGLRGQVAAKDAEKSTVHALARTEVHRELEELKRLVTKLEDFKRSMTAKEKAAEEIHV
ncbi:hypothetical protein R1flu_025566 [Riccia fluitans]|uniref:Uncharacterized protein n=1 Tax=Riccia fluitans TaxID=41844 RepID=A0ABD1XYK1_9MARC